MSDPFEPPVEPTTAITEVNLVIKVEAPEPGFLNRPSHFPVPRFGPLCVCCNAPSTHNVQVDPGDSHQLTGKLDVPVCPDCGTHFRKSRASELFFVLPGGLGGALVLFGLFMLAMGEPAGWMVGIGLAGVAVPIVHYLVSTRLHVGRARGGHHTMFAISVGPGVCAIRTTNPVLVDHLTRAHGAAVQHSEIPRG